MKRLIGESAAFLAATGKIPLAARCDAGVFISGETGTGKEMCARAIHYLSARLSGPFVPVNCGAIPTELVENELFGHERGAFTGALTAQHGMLHEAEGGTLFLDEIDCLPPLAQTKLLRFLQEKEYRPLGSTKARVADVRFLAASNLNPAEALRQGKLRRDLYYRLNVIPIALPALRERYEDIPLLARHFLAQYAVKLSKPVADITPAAISKLLFYDWPGNIRELEHTIELAVLVSTSDQLTEAEISLPDAESALTDEPFQQAKARIVAEFEKSYIQKLLLLHRGNISRAAESAHKNRRAFFQLIRKHRIDASLFRFSVV
ncbi:MAG: sigma-54-dependent Fis family transcriptional regulator [Acidobacteria bacterium]|nr:sigma-54-dependent Fis family transcriptional regulator [Acidobacteriota bacterium]